MDLPVRSDLPLIGLVGRLAEQKGIGLLQNQSAFNADGYSDRSTRCRREMGRALFFDIAAKYPEKFACYIGYRNDLAHQIEAGSDMFLMPSLFEPCGLNQIYSLRYGTVPIVRATGGLDDTIENYDSTSKSGTGFKFYDATPEALIGTVKWAVDTWYNDRSGFDKLRQNGMLKRFDWGEAAKGYEDLYRHIIAGRLQHEQQELR